MKRTVMDVQYRHPKYLNPIHAILKSQQIQLRDQSTVHIVAYRHLDGLPCDVTIHSYSAEMIKDAEIRRSCFYYDMFIERAYGTYEPDTPGCHADKMEALIMAEKEKEVSVDSIAHFEEQLIEIKRCMEEALNKYMAMAHVPPQIIDELKQTQEQVVYAVSSNELMNLVFKTIDLTVSVPVDMK